MLSSRILWMGESSLGSHVKVPMLSHSLARAVSDMIFVIDRAQ